ncbi:Protein of unknown function [Cotesia congregata]|uniref:Uncharacterized protein n=1 Tax=Cotesia congregata TaxID=51543 RepID=A0A8J2MMB4_COTCN|nr:Protein of unknown function [Cotesia congregata]
METCRQLGDKLLQQINGKLRPVWLSGWVHVNDERLYAALERLDLSDLDSSDSVDCMNAGLHRHIANIIDAVAPLKEICIRDQPAPWINQDIRTLQRRRSKLYRIFRRSGFAFNEYVNMRKVIKCRITDAKKQYFNQRFLNCKDAKSLWNCFRKLGLIKCSESNISTDLDLCGLNNYFAPDEQINYDYLDECVLTSRSDFVFNHLDCETVKKAITRLTSNSKGPDGFEIEAYKILLPYFLHQITELFNLSLSTVIYKI